MRQDLQAELHPEARTQTEKRVTNRRGKPSAANGSEAGVPDARQTGKPTLNRRFAPLVLYES